MMHVSLFVLMTFMTNLSKSSERSGSELLDTFDKSLFPYLLVGRRLKHALNSLGSELPGLAKVATTNYVYVNPDDLIELGATDGDL